MDRSDPLEPPERKRRAKRQRNPSPWYYSVGFFSPAESLRAGDSEQQQRDIISIVDRAEEETILNLGSPRKTVTFHLSIPSQRFFLMNQAEVVSEIQSALKDRQLTLDHAIPVPLRADEVETYFYKLLTTARLCHLDDIEIYFLGYHLNGPFNYKNELQALNLIVALINNCTCDEKKGLQLLLDAVNAEIRNLASSYPHEMLPASVAAEDETAYNNAGRLINWGKDEGIMTKIELGYFEDCGRGAVASDQIETGDIVLEVPMHLVISEERIVNDLSKVCEMARKDSAELLNLSCAEKFICWIMRERHNTRSFFKPYFDSMPENFKTGLRFTECALAQMGGTPLQYLSMNIQILRERWEVLKKLDNRNEIVPTGFCEWEHYLWASELWYTHSMKVIFDDGKPEICLIPVAGLFNHSDCPHIIHNGKGDNKSIKFEASRPCSKGDQCFISYGKRCGSTINDLVQFPDGVISGSELLAFYGFLPLGGNEHDVIPFYEIECDCGNCNEWGYHMMRISTCEVHPFPLRWWEYIRKVMRCRFNGGNNEEAASSSGGTFPSDKQMLEYLGLILDHMFSLVVGEPFSSKDYDSKDYETWDVKLALRYEGLCGKIIDSLLCHCKEYSVEHQDVYAEMAALAGNLGIYDVCEDGSTGGESWEYMTLEGYPF